MLPKLYSLRSDGKVQEWSVEVRDNAYRFHSGIKDGEIVTSEWTVCEGKNVGRANETTPQQQAESEARSHWTKKNDRGYKIDIADIHDAGFFEPMLAHDYSKQKSKVKFPIYAQPKLDGMRCIVKIDGMWSRQGKPVISAPHIKRALNPLFDLNPELVFDGELYADKFSTNFNKIISLAKKSKPSERDLDESEMNLEYHIYDLPSHTDTFGNRFAELVKLLGPVRAEPETPIRLVETHLVLEQTKLDELYGEWIERGYEGQMVRLNTHYENKRTANLLKRKEFIDEEFIIVDVLEGEGNRSGMAGKMLFETAANKPFKANIMGNRELYRELLANRHTYIGKMATVRYFEMTPDGVPRFGRVTKLDK